MLPIYCRQWWQWHCARARTLLLLFWSSIRCVHFKRWYRNGCWVFYYCDGCSVGENSIKMLIDLAQNSEYVFIYTNMFSQTINVTHISLVSVLLAENRLSPKRSLFLWSFICRTFPLSFHSSSFYDYYTLQIFEF